MDNNNDLVLSFASLDFIFRVMSTEYLDMPRNLQNSSMRLYLSGSSATSADGQ